MIGLDTNILVRVVVHDDERQFQAVLDFFAKEQKSFISAIVLCEFVWVLSGVYKYKKEQIIIIISGLLESKELAFEEPDVVEEAIKIFSAKNTKANFSDILIGLLNRKNGCTKTITFDKDAAKLDAFDLL